MELTEGRSPIEINREALKRILGSLVAMAGMGFGGAAGAGAGGRFTFFPRKSAAVQNQARAEKSKLSPALTLPRHLYRAILLLLRPAESAARRLIIAAARGIVVNLPPPSKPKPTEPPSPGIAVAMPPADHARVAAEQAAARPRAMSLPLFDPLRLPPGWSIRSMAVESLPGVKPLDRDAQFRPLPVPHLPSPADPIDAARLALRLEALGRALDDLPKHAQRFARWKARCDAALARRRGRDAAGAQDKQPREPWRPSRIWPLRGGRPPGGRLRRYDPEARRRKNIREVDEILAHCHSMALYALERPRPDTS